MLWVVLQNKMHVEFLKGVHIHQSFKVFNVNFKMVTR